MNCTDASFRDFVQALSDEQYPIDAVIKKRGVTELSLLSAIRVVYLCNDNSKSLADAYFLFYKYKNEEIEWLGRVIEKQDSEDRQYFEDVRKALCDGEIKHASSKSEKKNRELNLKDPWVVVASVALSLKESSNSKINKQWFYYRVLTLKISKDLVDGVGGESLLMEYAEKSAILFDFLAPYLRRNIEASRD